MGGVEGVARRKIHAHCVREWPLRGRDARAPRGRVNKHTMPTSAHEQFEWRWLPFGAAALLLEATPATPLANRLVVALADQLTVTPPDGVSGAVPAISSLLVTFDPLQTTLAHLRPLLERLLADLEPASELPVRVVTIPVCYGGTSGPDLESAAQLLGLSPHGLVALHSGQIYRVMMLGFAPGFPYIGPLPAALRLPRRSTPRSSVAAGSVAIAAGLTGIYPARLPGGWHLIGQTNLSMFDPMADPPALLAAGDGVRFVAEANGVVP